jgi:hypothetical protein
MDGQVDARRRGGDGEEWSYSRSCSCASARAHVLLSPCSAGCTNLDRETASTSPWREGVHAKILLEEGRVGQEQNEEIYRIMTSFAAMWARIEEQATSRTVRYQVAYARWILSGSLYHQSCHSVCDHLVPACFPCE